MNHALKARLAYIYGVLGGAVLPGIPMHSTDWRHDPERLRAAEERRARRNRKRATGEHRFPPEDRS